MIGFLGEMCVVFLNHFQVLMADQFSNRGRGYTISQRIGNEGVSVRIRNYTLQVRELFSQSAKPAANRVAV